MKYVNDSGLQVLAVFSHYFAVTLDGLPRLVPLRLSDHAHIIHRDDIAGQGVAGQEKTNELFEVRDARRAARGVVVAVAGREADGQIPSEPDAAHERAERARHHRP